jgi:hypothetical protein
VQEKLQLRGGLRVKLEAISFPVLRLVTQIALCRLDTDAGFLFGCYFFFRLAFFADALPFAVYGKCFLPTLGIKIHQS